MTQQDILESIYQNFGQKYGYENVKKYPELMIVAVRDESGLWTKIVVSKSP